MTDWLKHLPWLLLCLVLYLPDRLTRANADFWEPY